MKNPTTPREFLDHEAFDRYTSEQKDEMAKTITRNPNGSFTPSPETVEFYRALHEEWVASK